MGGRFKNDNKGVTLVEVIIVVAIMAVVGSVGIMSINAMSGKPAQKCSQQIVYSLEKHRTSTMGKVNAKYELCIDDSTDKVVAKEYLTNEDTFPADPTNVYVLGDKRTDVKYGLNYQDVDDAPSLRENGPITFQFNRASGAFEQQPDGRYCTHLYVQRGGRTYTVKLVPLTGKIYTE